MKPESQLSPDQKHCPICSQDLSVSEFGICRARKDGRNLYCKSCIRNKVTQSRRALKEYKSARKKYVSQQIDIAEYLSNESGYGAQHPSKPLSKLSPVERVRDSIRRGAKTQKEIAQDTKLGKDEIGDALANLLLWTREIRTRIVENTRMLLSERFRGCRRCRRRTGITGAEARRSKLVQLSAGIDAW